MRPFILDNDIVEITPILPTQLKRNDIVLCHLCSNRIVLHRVIKIQEQGLVIQGDAHAWPDGQVPRDQIMGRVSEVYRTGKRIPLDTPVRSFALSVWMWLTPLRKLVYYSINLVTNTGK
jgi:hypothetical protein